MTEQYHARITQETSDSGATWNSAFYVTCAVRDLFYFLTRRMRLILLKSSVPSLIQTGHHPGHMPPAMDDLMIFLSLDSL